MAAYLINVKYKNKNDSINDKTARTLLTTVDIIKDEIRNMKFNNDLYPALAEIADLKGGAEWIPDSLYTILQALIPSEQKSISIGQSIVRASKIRSVIAPILFGHGVTLDHSFDSKWPLGELARLGFSISLDEVRYLLNQSFFFYRYQF